MDETRNRRLHELLRRLGQAVHGSVVRSDEVRGCLEELGEQGWRAVMLVETAVACDEKGELETAAGTLRVHVNVDQDGPAYRIDAADTHLLAWLAHIGQAEAPQGKADILEVKGPGTFLAKLFVKRYPSWKELPPVKKWVNRVLLWLRVYTIG